MGMSRWCILREEIEELLAFTEGPHVPGIGICARRRFHLLHIRASHAERLVLPRSAG
jgi:hypothetical protein